MLFGWYYFANLFSHPLWNIGVSIVFLYSSLIMGVSAIIAISEDNIFISSFILLFIGVLVGVLGFTYTQQASQWHLNKLVNDFYANISTELISIVITVLAIQKLQERKSWRNHQREKIRQETNPPTVPLQTGEEIRSFPQTTQSHADSISQESKAKITSLILVGTALGFLIGLFWKRDH